MRRATLETAGLFILMVMVVACGSAPATATAAAGRLSGKVSIDGSSTVFPISEAMAEEFQAVHPGVRVTVGVSGTGGGFKKFIAGEIDISDASRPIKSVEQERAAAAGIDFIELPVAYDGLSILVNPGNTFVDHLTVEELRRIWEPGSSVHTWNDVRSGWPEREIHLYGPGPDSGTFDYFTEAIVGKEDACRPDFTASEDDNVLVRGIAGDGDALGFFGYAYYAENRDRLRAVPVDGGGGPVLPEMKTISDGTYAPLSRPIFIYVRGDAAGRAEVESFVHFYLDQAVALVAEVGYVPLPPAIYSLVRQRFDGRRPGSIYGQEGDDKAATLAELLR